MNAQVAYQKEDFYRPDREIKLDGKTLDLETLSYVVELHVFDSLEEIDAFSMTVANEWNPRTQQYRYSAGPEWLPGKTVEIALGYRGHDALSPMIKGEILRVAPEFPHRGPPVMRVHGRSVLHRFLQKQNSAVYLDKTDTEIAKEIAGRLGVDFDGPVGAGTSEPRYDYVIQDNQYDIVFLTERARRLGYELYLTERNGTFVLRFAAPEGRDRSVFKLGYGAVLRSFSPCLDASEQVSTVTLKAWDGLDKQTVSATAQRAAFAAYSGFDSLVGQAFKDREDILVDLPVANQDQADALARGTMARIMRGMLTAEGSSIGLPALRAGVAVDIDDLDGRYDGRYRVTATHHSFTNDGYFTRFRCRREER